MEWNLYFNLIEEQATTEQFDQVFLIQAVGIFICVGTIPSFVTVTVIKGIKSAFLHTATSCQLSTHKFK